jgi:hypothetical protein
VVLVKGTIYFTNKGRNFPCFKNKGNYSHVLKTRVFIPMFSNKGRKREIIPHTTHKHTNTQTHKHTTTRQQDNKTRTNTQIIPHTTHDNIRQQDNKTTTREHTHKYHAQHKKERKKERKEGRKEKHDTHKTHYTRKKEKWKVS